jgi:hypothetical protein
MSTMTPEWSKDKKKFFPTESSVSGYTPEYTVGGKQAFQVASAALKTGNIVITPESTKNKGKQYPLEASLNT